MLRATPVQSQTGTAPAVAVRGSSPPGSRYGDPAWWAQRKEEIPEPALEIVDPHHHLWDRKEHRYLLDQLLADSGSGHNITQSAFVECGSMYRARRAGGDEAGRRNRIRQRHGGDELSAERQSGTRIEIRLQAALVRKADGLRQEPSWRAAQLLLPGADHRRMNPKLRRQLRQGLLPRKRRHRHPRLKFRAVLLPLYAHVSRPFGPVSL